MAQQLRVKHNLVTLRCDWQPGPEGAHVSVRLIDGREFIDELTLPAADFGLQETLSPRAYRGVELTLPDTLDKLLTLAVERIGPGRPLWIHIAREASALAVLPWELLLRQRPILDGAAILRIPNFLADPFRLSAHTKVAVCISSPNAKMPFSAADYGRRLVGAISELATRPVTLHIFTDLDAFHELSSLSGGGMCNVIVHEPSHISFDENVQIDRQLAIRDHRIQNPWMLWMTETLQGEPIDAVHFICPGYFHEDRGSLALAETPVKNRDSRWSRFVGAEEIHALLDTLGAHTVGFSAPHIDVWAMGLRLLAFHLSWIRPGPIMVHDGGIDTFDDVPRNYAYLFDWVPDHVPAPVLRTEFYCHPILTTHNDGSDLQVEDRLNVSEDMLALADTPSEHPPNLMVGASDRADRSSGQSDVSWVELATRHFDLHEASLSAIEQDSGSTRSERKASLEAIRFMRQALETSTATAAPIAAQTPDTDSTDGEL